MHVYAEGLICENGECPSIGAKTAMQTVDLLREFLSFIEKTIEFDVRFFLGHVFILDSAVRRGFLGG